MRYWLQTVRYWVKWPWNVTRAWWTDSIYVCYRDPDGTVHEVFVQTYPAVRCVCGEPATRRDTGDIYQYGCAFGKCGFGKYERK